MAFKKHIQNCKWKKNEHLTLKKDQFKPTLHHNVNHKVQGIIINLDLWNSLKNKLDYHKLSYHALSSKTWGDNMKINSLHLLWNFKKPKPYSQTTVFFPSSLNAILKQLSNLQRILLHKTSLHFFPYFQVIFKLISF